MRINELLTESQVQQLDEGPFGQAVGKAVGGLAKGVGAVAGGVAGMGKAFKKGYQSGKATVAGDPNPNEPLSKQYASPDDAEPAAGAAPAAEPVGGPTAQPAAGDVNKAGPAGTAAAKPLQGAAKVAADKTAAATAGQDQAAAGQTMYAQIKANIDKLDKKGKQRILQLLQKSIQTTAAGAGAASPAAGAASPAAGTAAPQAAPAGAAPERVAPPGEEPTAGGGAAPAAPAAGQPDALGRIEPTLAPEPTTAPAQQTAPKKKAPKTKAAPAAPAAPAAEPAPKRTGGKVKGQVSMTPNAVRKREKRLGKQAPQGQSQAELDADRDRLMGNFTDSVERHKQRMVAEAFNRGEISLFRKR